MYLASEAGQARVVWPFGEGRSATLVREKDWSETSLGPLWNWSDRLKTAVDICLGSAFASFVLWGPDLVQIFNDAALPLVGAGHADKMGMPANEVWGDDWGMFGPVVEEARLNGHASGVDVAVSREWDGRRATRHFTFSIQALRGVDGAIEGMVLTGFETTQKVRAEKALRHSEERLRLALEAAHAGVWDLDIETGRIVGRSMRHDHILGFDDFQPEWSLDRMIQAVAPEDRKDFEAGIAQAMHTGRFDARVRIVPADGTPMRWAAFKGALRGEGGKRPRMVGIVVDISAHKEAERSLKVERDLLKAVLGVLYVGVLVMDADGAMLHVNPQAMRIFHCADEHEFASMSESAGAALSFRTMDRTVLSRDEWPVESLVAGVTMAGCELFVTRCGFPEKRLRYVSAIIPSPDGGVAARVLCMTDVTLRRRNEDELRESRMRLQSILDSAADAIVVIDGAGVIRSANKAVKAVFGYFPFEIVGKSAAALVSPKMMASELETLATQLKEGGVPPSGIARQIEGRRKDGSIFPLDLTVAAWDGEEKYTVIYRDATARKQNEDRLREMSEVVQQTGNSVVIADPNGVLEWVNPAFCASTGYTPEEVIGQPPGFLRSDSTSRVEFQRILKRVANGEIWRGEIRSRRKNGELFWEAAIISPIRDEAGRVTHLVSIKDDVTERKLAAEELAAARRVEALGHLAGGVAHDFNNLLAVLSGALELAHDVMTEGRPKAAVMRAIDRAQEGGALTQRLLSLARKRPLSPAPVNIGARLEEIQALLRSSVGERIHVEVSLADGLWAVKADKGEIDSVLLNLVANARDAMPDGGRIEIMTRNEVVDEGRARGPSSGEYVVLSVKDIGHGMTAEVRSRAIDPFFTTKKNGRGTGLGLSTAAGFARQSGGALTIDSEEGRGTTVTLYLPRVRGSLSDPSVDEDGVPLGRGEKILVVEDDIGVREVTLARVKSLGYSVAEASSGLAAIEILDDDMDISVVLSDVVMPGGVSGYDLATWIEEERSEVPILLMSGYNQGERGSGERVAQCRVLNKPFTREALARELRNALGG